MNTDVKAQQENIRHYGAAMQADRESMQEAYKAFIEKDPEKAKEFIRRRLLEIGMLQEKAV